MGTEPLPAVNTGTEVQLTTPRLLHLACPVHIAMNCISFCLLFSRVEGPLLALGWKRTTDKFDERYRLKWVECKSKINYTAFKEGNMTFFDYLCK